ncbi:hypothetical protein [Flavobacterium sp. LAR06]|uniref:hypothetical protein n=1 Tax=Flavobacterium sp. LAR06 TaxID=3064897 RepID=UPI0035BFE917
MNSKYDVIILPGGAGQIEFTAKKNQLLIEYDPAPEFDYKDLKIKGFYIFPKNKKLLIGVTTKLLFFLIKTNLKILNYEY